jgi:RhoGEF domain
MAAKARSGGGPVTAPSLPAIVLSLVLKQVPPNQFARSLVAVANTCRAWRRKLSSDDDQSVQSLWTQALERSFPDFAPDGCSPRRQFLELLELKHKQKVVLLKLVRTERKYIRTLERISEEFYAPLSTDKRFGPQSIRIANHVNQMCDVHQQLLRQLECEVFLDEEGHESVSAVEDGALLAEAEKVALARWNADVSGVFLVFFSCSSGLYTEFVRFHDEKRELFRNILGVVEPSESLRSEIAAPLKRLREYGQLLGELSCRTELAPRLRDAQARSQEFPHEVFANAETLEERVMLYRQIDQDKLSEHRHGAVVKSHFSRPLHHALLHHATVAVKQTGRFPRGVFNNTCYAMLFSDMLFVAKKRHGKLKPSIVLFVEDLVGVRIGEGRMPVIKLVFVAAEWTASTEVKIRACSSVDSQLWEEKLSSLAPK